MFECTTALKAMMLSSLPKFIADQLTAPSVAILLQSPDLFNFQIKRREVVRSPKR
jgi:hypothetical protein